MITGIELCLKHRLKIKGSETLRFQPGVNVLVGPNGSDKSTVLRALHTCRVSAFPKKNILPHLRPAYESEDKETGEIQK